MRRYCAFLSDARLGSQFSDLSGTHFRDRSSQWRSDWTKIAEAIGLRTKNDHRKRPLFKVLLFWQTLIDGDQDIEAPRYGIEQRAIVKIGPSHLRSGPPLVARRLIRQAARHTTIQEHTHETGYFETLRGYRLVEKRRFRKL